MNIDELSNKFSQLIKLREKKYNLILANHNNVINQMIAAASENDNQLPNSFSICEVDLTETELEELMVDLGLNTSIKLTSMSSISDKSTFYVTIEKIDYIEKLVNARRNLFQLSDSSCFIKPREEILDKLLLIAFHNPENPCSLPKKFVLEGIDPISSSILYEFLESIFGDVQVGKIGYAKYLIYLKKAQG